MTSCRNVFGAGSPQKVGIAARSYPKAVYRAPIFMRKGN